MTIQVINQNDRAVLLDMFENDPVNLKYQYTDIEEIGSAASSFSQTFRIPATENNRRAFGEMHDSNFTDITMLGNPMYNPKRRMQAWILVNTIPVAVGYVQLKNAVISNGSDAEYTITFFGQTNEFARVIGDKRLSDMDWSALNHNLNSTIVQNSWAGGFPASDPGAIVYGMIDKGFLFASNGFGQPITNNFPLRAGQFTPFVSLRRMVNEIFEQAGFKLESNLFTGAGDTEDMYVPFWRGGAAIRSVEGIEVQQFATRITTNQAEVSTGQVSTFSVNNTEGTGVTFDQTGDFAGGEFTPSYSGFYRFRLAAKVACPVSWIVQARVGIRKTSGTPSIVWLDNEYTEVSDDVTAPTQLFAETPYVWMELGESYEQIVQIFTWSAITSPNFFVIYADDTLPTEETTGWDLLPLTIPTAGITVDMAANVPDISILDFLKGLQAMFNLVLIPDPSDPYTMRLDSWNNYMDTGASKDWTEYLDISKDVVLKPTTDIQRRRYEWRYSEDGDILNQAYIVNAQRTFGRFRITDVQNDFATGEKVVESTFAPYPVNALGQNNLTVQWLIHRGYDVDGNVVANAKPRVAYYGGLKPYGGQIGAPIWDDSISDVVEIPDVPHFGNYDVRYPTATDRDLNFGGDVPFHTIQANPINNLFNTYWRRFNATMYSTNSRVMEAHFALDEVELSTFRYNDRIFIKDSVWRVIDISYTPNGGDTSKVTLLKDFTDTPPCSVVPIGSDIQGIIQFVDSTGAPAAATQECCELFGYNWVNINGTMRCGGAIFDTDPADGRDPIINPGNGGGINGGGINVETGAAIAWGQDVQVPTGVTGVIGGSTVKVGSQVNTVLATGNRVLIESGQPNLPPADGKVIEGVLATGLNVHAFESGQHRGGGAYFDSISDPQQTGQAQAGQFTMVYEGDFDDKDEVELFINGVDGNRLFTPNNCAMYLQFDVLITYFELVGSDYIPSGYYGLTWLSSLRNRANTLQAGKSGYNDANWIGGVGYTEKDYQLQIAPSTDGQFEIWVKSLLSSAQRARIVANVSYVMAKI